MKIKDIIGNWFKKSEPRPTRKPLRIADEPTTKLPPAQYKIDTDGKEPPKMLNKDEAPKDWSVYAGSTLIRKNLTRREARVMSQDPKLKKLGPVHIMQDKVKRREIK